MLEWAKMLKNALRRGGFVAALAIGLMFLLPATGFTHSGGTDKNGCHAGSQPYHCHNGGGGSVTPPASSGPTAAEQAEIANAQTELAQAKANRDQSKPLALKLEDRLESAEEKSDRQRSSLEDLQDEVDRGREEAANLRAAHIADREDAAERIGFMKRANRVSQDDFVASRLLIVYAAAVFGGFLLFIIAKLVSALISGTAWRIATVLAGLLGSIALLGIARTVVSFSPGVLPAVGGGLLLSFVFMLARAWWMAATVPAAVTAVFLGFAGLVAIAAVVFAVTAAPPVAEQPAPEDQAMVEEAQSDPAAEELDQAQQVEAIAEELQPDIDELTNELDEVESKVEALAERTEAAKAKAQADAEAVQTASEELESLQ